jgi:hypothetical protein
MPWEIALAPVKKAAACHRGVKNASRQWHRSPIAWRAPRSLGEEHAPFHTAVAP